MADSTDLSTGAPRKKKTLAFLRSTPKPAPVYEKELDPSKDQGEKNSNEDEDDGLDMFKRSKHFFPLVIKEQDYVSREATPESKLEAIEYTTEHSDKDPIPSSARSSKRRKLSSPAPENDHPWRTESYDELYGPATPPRRASKSPAPDSDKPYSKQLTPESTKQVPHSTEKSKGKSRETIALVQSDLLPTPTSRSNSHQLNADPIAPDSGDDDLAAGANSWRDHTPSPRKAKLEVASAKKEQAPSPIVLDDSDDDDDLSASATKPVEDEFAHFVAAARKKQEAARAAAAALAPSTTSPNNAQDPLTRNASRADAEKRAPFIPVKIFVHSRIAAHAEYDMRGFGCKRKLDQKLGPVKGAFVQYLRKEGVSVSDEMEQAIFLTWKGRRIYNSVSGLGLGWQPQGNGKIHTPEREPGFINGGVLLEAWTEEDFARYTADLERQRLIDRGELVETGPGVEIEDNVEEAVPAVAKVRLFLKQKDTEAVRLTSYLDTQVRILIGAYRKQKKVPDDRDIMLRHEGEWLDPNITVEEADIDDMCTVEVYLR